MNKYLRRHCVGMMVRGAPSPFGFVLFFDTVAVVARNYGTIHGFGWESFSLRLLLALAARGGNNSIPQHLSSVEEPTSVIFFEYKTHSLFRVSSFGSLRRRRRGEANEIVAHCTPDRKSRARRISCFLLLKTLVAWLFTTRGFQRSSYLLDRPCRIITEAACMAFATSLTT